MENASKALLMAGGILISVVILSLAVYLFVSFSNSTAEMQRQLEIDAIDNFNSEFLYYNGKEDLTIYDVYTVSNMAQQNNVKYGLENEGIKSYNFYIAVFLDVKSDTVTTGIEKEKLDYKTFVNNYMYQKPIDKYGNVSLEFYRYKCEVKINENTGRVNKVIFILNNK